MANGLVKRYGKGTDSDATDTLVFAGHGEGEADVANALKVPSHGASWSGGSSDTFVATSFHPTQTPIHHHHHHHHHAIGKESGGGAVQQGASVRRLLPVECERLQALPDRWTDLGRTPDSRRYAALGDAVTVTVAEWIGRRILTA